MPHILIISMNYAPEETGTGPYSAGTAQALRDAGMAVTVVAGLPHYPAWRIARSHQRTFRAREIEDGICVLRRGHYVPTTQSAVRRAAYEGTFLLNGAIGVPSGIDAVIGIVPALADGVLARMTASLRSVPYGLVFQDLMGPAATQSGVVGGARVASLAQRVESWSVAKAARNAAVTDAFFPYLRSIGADDDRLDLLPNWTRLAAPGLNRFESRRRLGWDTGEVVALHTGNMGLKQGLEVIVSAARLAADRRLPVRFVVVGDGNQRQRIEAKAAGLPSMELRPLVPSSELPDLLIAADVLLVTERPSVSDMSIPSKLTSYVASGRPVVASVVAGGATAREIARSGAGVVTPAGDPVELLAAITSIGSDMARADELGAAGIKYARTVLDPAAAAERYVTFAHQILASRSEG